MIRIGIFLVATFFVASIKAQGGIFPFFKENPYAADYRVEAARKYDRFCDDIPDLGCYYEFMNKLGSKHLRNNFDWYKPIFDRFGIFVLAAGSGIKFEEIQHYPKLIAHYDDNIRRTIVHVFAWELALHFTKNKTWPKDDGYKFSWDTFVEWIDKNPQNLGRIIKRIQNEKSTLPKHYYEKSN